VQFKTNNLEPKWDDWYNYADWMFEIEILSSETIKYTIGIEELDSSWKAKVSKGSHTMYEYEWIYNNSAFTGVSDGQTIDETIGGDSSGDGGNSGDGSSGGTTIILDLPDLKIGAGPTFAHNYTFAENGDNVNLTWTTQDTMTAYHAMNLTLDGQFH